MIALPNVTLILIGHDSPENQRAIDTSTRHCLFAKTVRIEALPTYADYNRFVLTELHRHFDTSHCLLIQDDGYVWHPEAWEDSFLAYDYIGAVWHNGFVGNGGFSLRSKHLCEMSEHLWYNTPLYRSMFEINPAEDMLTCMFMQAGLSNYRAEGAALFAPPSVADKFSWELSDMRPTPLKSFGFHGKHTMERMKALNI